MEKSYKIAGIDVHKSMLAVVVADAALEGEFRFERRKLWIPDDGDQDSETMSIKITK